MKKLFFLFVFALVGMTGAIAQWLTLNPGIDANFSSVFFIDADTGFVSGLKTTDGGISWMEIVVPGGSMYFTSADTGYAASFTKDGTPSHGKIWKTTDGGINWTLLVDEGPFSGFLSVYFTSSDSGYAAGWNAAGGCIRKTTDGGLNWSSHTFEDLMLQNVFFPTTSIGYIVGTDGSFNCSVLKTTNGGNDWTSQSIGSSYEIQSVYFTDVNTGYIVGKMNFPEVIGVILKTVDGGANWASQSFDNTVDLKSVFFTNANTGYIVGYNGQWPYYEGIIITTADAGTTWAQQFCVEGYVLNSVQFPTQDTGYIVGDGIILKTTNGGLTGLNGSKVVINSLNIFPNPARNMITISMPALSGKTQLSIFNLAGEKLIGKQISSKETTFTISALPPGVYFVRVQDEKKIETIQFIKQ